MKKILLVMLALFSMFLTGCSGEKELDFTLISEDYQAENVAQDSFILIKDYPTFKMMFSEYKSIKEFEGISHKTFKNHTLVYFVYNSPIGVYDRYAITLNKVIRKDQTLFFEIIIPEFITDAFIIQTMYYLIKVDNSEIEGIKNCQATWSVDPYKPLKYF